MSMSPPSKRRHIDDSLDESSLPLPSPSASPIHSSSITEITDKKQLLTTLLETVPYKSRNIPLYINQLINKSSRAELSLLYANLNTVLKKDMITAFPLEISYKIFSQLSHKDLITASMVSYAWNSKLLQFTDLWKNLLFRENLITEAEYNHEIIDNTPKEIYKQRYIIQQHWMDPSFIPKHTTLQGDDSLNVITCLQFDDEKIAVGSNVDHISIFNSTSYTLQHKLTGHTGGVWAMKFYGNILASGSTDRTIRIWNTKTGKCTHIFRGHVSTVRCLEIIEPKVIGTDDEGNDILYPKYPLLVTGSRDATLYIWKLPSEFDYDEKTNSSPFNYEPSDNPYFIRVLKGHNASIRAVTGHANILISGSYDSTARVWDLRTGECIFVLIGHTDRIYSCVYDVERNVCYTASVDNTVRIWDLTTGKTKHILEGHQILVGLITSSPNALISAAADSTVRIWDPDTGMPKHVLRGHTSAITCVANDDYKVLSGSQGMLKLWNVKDGSFVRDLVQGVDGSVWQVGFDYKKCVVAVQRGETTFVEVTDFE